MQTTCPECRTTFRVSQDHLGARRGLVRCGHCNAVFNAYDTLLPELDAPTAEELAAEPVQTTHQTAHQTAHQTTHAAAPNLSEVIHAASTPAKPVAPAAPAPVSRLEEVRLEESLLDDRFTANLALDTLEITSLQSSAPAEKKHSLAPLVENEQPFSLLAAEKPATVEPLDISNILLEPLWANPPAQGSSWKTGFYGVFALLLTAVLMLQLVYFMRGEIVSAVPQARPSLAAFCQLLRCEVPLPRQLTRESITSSSLEQNPEQKSRVHLILLLSNRSGQIQTWPHIALTLSDVREVPVAQQVFAPQIYLPKAVNIAAGMAVDAEREIRLDLDIGNLVASGYTLNLIYP